MPKLKRLTAKQVLAILTGFGFVIVSQRGSHIKLVRVVHDQRQILTLPITHKSKKANKINSVAV